MWLVAADARAARRQTRQREPLPSSRVVVSAYLPSLYKARGLSVKQEVCAICLDRTRGRTELVRLSHGVVLWLCAGHASREFQTRRGGRDFNFTLMRLWRASGCLTLARRRALEAHLAAQQSAAAKPRQRPGSYAWPLLRAKLELAFAAGAQPERLHAGLAALFSGPYARPPSRSTLRRWQREQRWLTPPQPP